MSPWAVAFRRGRRSSGFGRACQRCRAAPGESCSTLRRSSRVRLALVGSQVGFLHSTQPSDVQMTKSRVTLRSGRSTGAHQAWVVPPVRGRPVEPCSWRGRRECRRDTPGRRQARSTGSEKAAAALGARVPGGLALSSAYSLARVIERFGRARSTRTAARSSGRASRLQPRGPGRRDAIPWRAVGVSSQARRCLIAPENKDCRAYGSRSTRAVRCVSIRRRRGERAGVARAGQRGARPAYPAARA